MTFRAVEVLSTVTQILAEDTRHSRTLLDHYNIRTPMVAYHEHNEAKETPRAVARLQAGESLALISDAGTPLVSDPGARLVKACVEAGIAVVPVPGASALLSALVASGISAERFTFFGFVPRKGKERAATLEAIVHSPVTSVLYEAPNRVRETLEALAECGAGERETVVARELTKKFETLYRGTISQLSEQLDAEVRGEVVIVVSGQVQLSVTEDEARRYADEVRAKGGTPRDIVEYLTRELGVARNLAYKIAHTEESPR